MLTNRWGCKMKGWEDGVSWWVIPRNLSTLVKTTFFQWIHPTCALKPQLTWTASKTWRGKSHTNIQKEGCWDENGRIPPRVRELWKLTHVLKGTLFSDDLSADEFLLLDVPAYVTHRPILLTLRRCTAMAGLSLLAHAAVCKRSWHWQLAAPESSNTREQKCSCEEGSNGSSGCEI